MQLKASQHWALLPFVVGIMVGLTLSTLLLIRPTSMEYVVTNVYIGAPAGAPHHGDRELTDKMRRFEELMHELHPEEVAGTGPQRLADEVGVKALLHYSVIVSDTHSPGSSDAVDTLRYTWGRDVAPEGIDYFIPASYQLRETPPGRTETVPSNIVKITSDELNVIQVLRHVCGHKMNSSKWFYVGYDNAYVKVPELEAFLLSLEMCQGSAPYIGRPVQKESLPSKMCLPGPGSILSYQALAQICPKLSVCEGELDPRQVNVLGECVHKILPSVTCNKEGHPQNLFLWYDSGKAKGPIIDPKHKVSLSRALTIFPVDDHKLMYNIHQLVVGRRLNDSQHLARELKQSVEQMRAFLPQGDTTYTQRGTEGVESREDIRPWQLINHDRVMEWDSSNPARKIPSYWKTEVDALATQAIEFLSTTQEDKELVFSQLVNAYWRLHPLTGMEYIVDFEAKSTHSGESESLPPARFCATLVRPYSPIEISPVQPQVRDSKRVTVVVVMTGEQLSAFEIFMKRLGVVMDASQGGLNLLVVKMRLDGEMEVKKTDSSVESILHSFEQKYLRSSFSLITSPYILSRSHGLALALHEVKPTDILFLADLHLTFDPPFLERCRALPLQGQQVYYPIPFAMSGATPNTSTSLSAELGHWLVKSVSVSCIYAADVLSSVQQEGGKGIPKEVDTTKLYKSLLEKGYEVIRSVDSALWKDQGGELSCELDFIGDVQEPCSQDQAYPYKQLHLRTHLSELLFDHEREHSEPKF